MPAEGSRRCMEYPKEYVSKFEIARVLGLRTTQIAQEGISDSSSSRAEAIAIRELLAGTIPYVVRRVYPTGVVDVPLSTLKLHDDAIDHLQRVAARIQNKTG